MRPASFVVFRPSTLREAVELLSENDDAKLLAGGQSLIPMMKLRIFSPPKLVSLARVRELRPSITDAGGYVTIGALTTYEDISTSSVVREKLPALAKAASEIADQQIRNRGTIGGNVCHGDSAANLGVTLLALNATLVVEGSRGTRKMAIDGFHLGPFSVALEHDEVLKAVEIPYSPSSRQTFMKISKTATTWPMASVAVNLNISPAGDVQDARISLGVAGPTALRAEKAEDYLKGKGLSHEVALRAGELATEGLNPPSDIHAPSEYRLQLLRVLVTRSLESLGGAE
jgi:carbon-monoxide dehydrogenase medium subunit